MLAISPIAWGSICPARIPWTCRARLTERVIVPRYLWKYIALHGWSACACSCTGRLYFFTTSSSSSVSTAGFSSPFFTRSPSKDHELFAERSASTASDDRPPGGRVTRLTRWSMCPKSDVLIPRECTIVHLEQCDHFEGDRAHRLHCTHLYRTRDWLDPPCGEYQSVHRARFLSLAGRPLRCWLIRREIRIRHEVVQRLATSTRVSARGSSRLGHPAPLNDPATSTALRASAVPCDAK